jgi:exopolysaccharide production protein ExoQ
MTKTQYHSFILGPAEKIFTVVMLFYTTGAILPFIVGERDPLSPPQINPIELAVKAALYAGTFFFIAFRWRCLVRNMWNIKWIMVLVLIAIVSTAWSQDPYLTLHASAVLVATTAFGVYFGTRYTVPQQLRLLGWACFSVVALSFLFAIFLPKYGIDQDVNHGAWQGIFAQKNALGMGMVLAIFVFAFMQPKRFHSLRWLGVAASLALLLLSQSATEVIVCAGIIAMLALYAMVRARGAITIPFFAVGLPVIGLLLSMNFTIAQAAQLVGRSPDLTGRTELWNAVLISISKRPWFGYGFSAFWLGMKGESGSVLRAIGWPAGYAHNGYLDLGLHLGVLGLIIFAVGYLWYWRRALEFLVRVPGPVAVWLCTFLVFMLLSNLTEGSILTQNSIYWVLYTSTAVSLSPACFRRLHTRHN